MIDRDFPGHFIGAADCGFFRTTDCLQTGVRVSTVGDYRPGAKNRSIAEILGTGAQTLGADDRLYETMVFRLGTECCPCGCEAPLVADWGELDMEGYTTQDEAIDGHRRMVERWAHSDVSL